MKTNNIDTSSAAAPKRTGGIILRKGRSTGSVTAFTARMIGYSHSGGRVSATIQDRTTAAIRK